MLLIVYLHVLLWIHLYVLYYGFTCHMYSTSIWIHLIKFIIDCIKTWGIIKHQHVLISDFCSYWQCINFSITKITYSNITWKLQINTCSLYLHVEIELLGKTNWLHCNHIFWYSAIFCTTQLVHNGVPHTSTSWAGYREQSASSSQCTSSSQHYPTPVYWPTLME